jgi:hypothetical protein
MKTGYITILVLIVLAATVLSYMQGWVHPTGGAHQLSYIAAALFTVMAVVIIRKRKKQSSPPPP